MMSVAKGVDVGTMFFQVAENVGDETSLKTVRNAFVEVPALEDIEDILQRNGWQYVKDDSAYYVIGEDSLQVAKIFPDKVEIRRPLADGVLNKGEDKKLVVLSEIVRNAVGQPTDNNSVVCTCVSSESVDGSSGSDFHKARLKGLFANLGWKVKIIEEGLAVILSEKPVATTSEGEEVPYTGIGISFGAGRVNCVLAYRGMQLLGMSAARSGDWIDRNVAEQTGTPLATVISTKEKRLDFGNLDYDDDVLFALDVYYSNMIQYVFSNFGRKFAEVKSEIDYPLDIIVAGGTSTPNGFCTKLENVVRGMNLPFEVGAVRHAESPRTAVVEGLLVQATVTQKKLQQDAADEEALLS